MSDDLKSQIAALKEKIRKARAAKGLDDASNGWDGISAANKVNFNSAPRPQRTLKGHFGKVYAMHWAGDSTQLVSASQDGKLIVWNAMTTNKVQAIPLRSSWVMTCAYEQKQSGMVACGGLDNLCSIYKLRADGVSNTRADKELAQHDGYLSCCRFIDPTRILTSSGDSTCLLWDVESGEPIQTFTDHGGDVMSVSINPTDSNVFASGSCDSNAKLWDARTGTCIKTFTGHESDINSVAFFPDGNCIGTGSDDSSCRLFDIRSFCEINQYGSEKILCGITSVSFSISGRILFAGYDDHHCYGWDTMAPEDSSQSYKILEHQNRVSCLGVNKQGDALATGSWDTLLKVFALPKAKK